MKLTSVMMVVSNATMPTTTHNFDDFFMVMGFLSRYMDTNVNAEKEIDV